MSVPDVIQETLQEMCRVR